MTKTSLQPKFRSQIGVINGLRGFSALAVLFYHSPYYSWINVGGIYNIVWSLSNVFYLFPLCLLSNTMNAVNFFFILSGFVLQMPYSSKFRNYPGFITVEQQDVNSSATTPSIVAPPAASLIQTINKFHIVQFFKDVLDFYKKRCGRLLPLYYVTLMIYIFFSSPLSGQDQPLNLLEWPNLRRLLLMLTMTFTFSDQFSPYFFEGYWSIGIEFWFSIGFPFFSVFLFYIPTLLVQRIRGCSSSATPRTSAPEPASGSPSLSSPISPNSTSTLLLKRSSSQKTENEEDVQLEHDSVEIEVTEPNPSELPEEDKKEKQLLSSAGIIKAFFLNPRVTVTFLVLALTYLVSYVFRSLLLTKFPKHHTPMMGSHLDEFIIGMCCAEFYCVLHEILCDMENSSANGSTTKRVAIALTLFGAGLMTIFIALNSCDFVKVYQRSKVPAELPLIIRITVHPWLRGGLNTILSTGMLLVTVGASLLPSFEIAKVIRMVRGGCKPMDVVLGFIFGIPHFVIYQVLGNSVIQLIGSMCYSIYLWHFKIQMYILVKLGTSFAHFALNAFFVSMLSFLSYRYIEFPHIPWKNIFKFPH